MSEVKIGKVTMGQYMTNCYFLYREGSKDMVFIDPADSGAYLYEQLSGKGFDIKAILLTHGHFDHIFGVKALKEKTGARVYACEAEKALLEDPGLNVSEGVGRPTAVYPDEFLHDGQEITLCDIGIKVIHTPGHTAGSCCFYVEEAGFLIAGDTLFEGSVGRTDLPTGSTRTMMDSIREKLFVLPDETKVYPGHGGSTTIGFEKENNPFF